MGVGLCPEEHLVPPSSRLKTKSYFEPQQTREGYMSTKGGREIQVDWDVIKESSFNDSKTKIRTS